MQTVEVAIKPVVKITLKPDTEVLDEVVVTGYGNFKKSSFTGAASSITTEKLQDVPSLSVQDKLAGSVAGVQITSTSGQPGAVESVRIRGMGSINAGNDPFEDQLIIFLALDRLVLGLDQQLLDPVERPVEQVVRKRTAVTGELKGIVVVFDRIEHKRDLARIGPVEPENTA